MLGCHIEGELPEFGMVQLRAGVALIDLVDVGVTAGQWARPDITGGRNVDHVCIAIARAEGAAARYAAIASSLIPSHVGRQLGSMGRTMSVGRGMRVRLPAP